MPRVIVSIIRNSGDTQVQGRFDVKNMTAAIKLSSTLGKAAIKAVTGKGRK